MGLNDDTNRQDTDNVVAERTNGDVAAIQDEEAVKPKKLPYPKSVFFIISNEFCERFMYYGMRTVLVLYLTRKLMYDDDTATVLYHSFTTLVYFICVFGAMISDSWLGKFKTILILSIVYALGSILLSVTAIEYLGIPGRGMTMLGLVLVAIGSGGIKPCVAAFGGDQFKMPEQAKQMAMFFSLFYFSINSGSFISTTITPILRQDVACFGDTECYPLAFGVPGGLMILSIFIFIFGKPLYIINKPAGNMVVRVTKCIANAISTKRREKTTNPREHWLDYAEPAYGKQLVNDTKILLKVLVLYIPLPVFWALFDQQGSRWTFQATRMDGTLGGFEVKPDQMQVLNPFLILIFIPLYDVLFYPLLSKIGIRRPLQKLTLGGILAGVAFLLSAFVELQLEKTYPILPVPNECQLRIFNSLPCNFDVTVSNAQDINIDGTLQSMQMFENKYVSVPEAGNMVQFTFTTVMGDCPTRTYDVELESNKAISLFFDYSGELVTFEDNPNKSGTGDPLLRILLNAPSLYNVTLNDHHNADNVVLAQTVNMTRTFTELYASTYNISIMNPNANFIATYQFRQGSVNTMLIHESANGVFTYNIIEITAPNSMNMLWLIPQYVVMTLGEVMYSVTGLAFSYSQAPISMKAVLQACWLLTVAFGNLIVVIVAGSKGFSSQAAEFFLFAGIMFLDMLIFMYLARRYKSVPIMAEDSETDQTEQAVIMADDKTKDNSLIQGFDNNAFKKD